MAIFYGPSDVISFRHADGHGHVFTADKREPVPGYGNTDRSLPRLDCAACAVWVQKQGWSSHPQKVQLTADEQEYEADSLRQGSMNMRLASEAMGVALARMAGQEQAAAPVATVRARRPAPRKRAKVTA